MVEPYHYWKALSAVQALACYEGPLRTRIWHALNNLSVLRSNDPLPKALREALDEIEAQVTWKQDGDPSEGTWANTLAAMDDGDATKVAELIVAFFESSLSLVDKSDRT